MCTTLHVAAVSELVGVAAEDDKHVLKVDPLVHAELDPHLHVAEVQMLDKVAPHSALVPHLQVPASHVSELPLQVTDAHGSTDKNVEKEFLRIKWCNQDFLSVTDIWFLS